MRTICLLFTLLLFADHNNSINFIGKGHVKDYLIPLLLGN